MGTIEEERLRSFYTEKNKEFAVFVNWLDEVRNIGRPEGRKRRVTPFPPKYLRFLGIISGYIKDSENKEESDMAKELEEKVKVINKGKFDPIILYDLMNAKGK